MMNKFLCAKFARMEKKHSLETELDTLIQQFDVKAVIFDLDGTLVDNNEYHLRTWKKYLEEEKIDISDEDYNKYVNGRTNKDAIEYIYGRKMSDAEAMEYALEKEAIYRKMYQPHIKPVEGLVPFLELLHEKGIPIAMATSGIQVNIDFMFDHIPIKKYFQVIVNSAHIQNGKPDPEIYLKAASLLNIVPENCLVFEDAAVGIQSAKAAGMKVIAIDTTQPHHELKEADRIIHNFKFEQN